MNLITAALITVGLLTTLAPAEPFTYQGQLQDNGTPASGIYDIVLRLHTAPTGGTQIGSTIQYADIQVTDGLFELEPDFGPDAFDGSPRYLAVFVRDGDAIGAYTELLPRTPITTTPQSHHALVADELTNPLWTEINQGAIRFGDGNDRVLINRAEPIVSTEYFGVHNNAPGFVGMFMSGPAGAKPYYGYSVNNLLSAYTYYNSDTSEWTLVNGGQALTVDLNQNLTVTNDLFADEVNADAYNFPTPKTNYLSISGDTFFSGSGAPFSVSGGTGGAYITAPIGGWLVAPVNLPHNATVTRVTFYGADTAPGDLNISLSFTNHGSTAFNDLATITTAGLNSSTITITKSGSTLFSPIINNNTRHYHIRAFSATWPGNSTMRIKSVVIEYTTTQAD